MQLMTLRVQVSERALTSAMSLLKQFDRGDYEAVPFSFRSRRSFRRRCGQLVRHIAVVGWLGCSCSCTTPPYCRVGRLVISIARWTGAGRDSSRLGGAEGAAGRARTLHCRGLGLRRYRRATPAQRPPEFRQRTASAVRPAAGFRSTALRRGRTMDISTSGLIPTTRREAAPHSPRSATASRLGALRARIGRSCRLASHRSGNAAQRSKRQARSRSRIPRRNRRRRRGRSRTRKRRGHSATLRHSSRLR